MKRGAWNQGLDLEYWADWFTILMDLATPSSDLPYLVEGEPELAEGRARIHYRLMDGRVWHGENYVDPRLIADHLMKGEC